VTPVVKLRSTAGGVSNLRQIIEWNNDSEVKKNVHGYIDDLRHKSVRPWSLMTRAVKLYVDDQWSIVLTSSLVTSVHGQSLMVSISGQTVRPWSVVN
jgi:hypothetical protein